MAGLEELARRMNITLLEMLQSARRLVHGTTVATNALLERKGAKVALLTTEGHRDILEMREGLKGDRYDLRTPAPEPLVPRQLRFGIRERVHADGHVIVQLDETTLETAILAMRHANVNSVAICFLNSFRNPTHELICAERVAKALPQATISRSSDVLPQIKEYERLSTTVVNAYVAPAVRGYLRRLENRLNEAGFSGSVFIILSHGGMAPIEEASRLAAATVLSGPAGGVSGSRCCAELLGIKDVVPFDMGGTSTDISLIANGQAFLSGSGGPADQRIALRSLDIVSIAAGGGSIASVDSSGHFQVGPESAGSVPGPACYAQGGTSPTITDANVVLGYLDAGSFMGGRRPLDRQAAENAIDRLANTMEISRIAAAAGAYRLVNLKMADGIRLMTVKRGLDPRRFALLSFGGAAGLHAVEVARELQIKRVIVPATASVMSAWGMLTSDLRYEVSGTYLNTGRRMKADEIRAFYSGLEAAATTRMRSWFDGIVEIEQSAEMRYGEQIFEVDVPLIDVVWESEDLADQLTGQFHQRHEQLYTYALPGEEVILVNGRVSAIGKLPRSYNLVRSSAGPSAAPREMRHAYFNSWQQVPVYSFDELPFKCKIEGPAIIQAETTTVIANANDCVSVNELGWLDISVGEAVVGHRHASSANPKLDVLGALSLN